MTVTRIWYRYDAVRVRQALRDYVSLHATRVSRERKFDRRPLWLVRGDGSAVRGAEGKGTDSLDLLAGFCFVKAVCPVLHRRSDDLPIGDASSRRSCRSDWRLYAVG